MYVQVLYVDTLFLSNFVMNMLALFLTGGLLRLPRRRLRFFLASLLGGVYATVAVVFSFPALLHIPFSLLLSVFLVLIAFPTVRGFFPLIRNFLLFYLSSILLGGAIDALFSFLSDRLSGQTPRLPSSSDVILLLGFLSYFLIRFLLRLLDGGQTPHSVSVRISFAEKKVTVPLLVDSGCLLSDPLTGKNAVIVSLSALRSLLPQELVGCAKEGMVSMPCSHALAGRCRLLPVEGVSGRRLMLAFRPDSVELLEDGEPLDVLVALYTGNAKRFGGCHGLLPSSVLFARGISKKSKKG